MRTDTGELSAAFFDKEMQILVPVFVFMAISIPFVGAVGVPVAVAM